MARVSDYKCSLFRGSAKSRGGVLRMLAEVWRSLGRRWGDFESSCHERAVPRRAWSWECGCPRSLRSTVSYPALIVRPWTLPWGSGSDRAPLDSARSRVLA